MRSCCPIPGIPVYLLLAALLFGESTGYAQVWRDDCDSAAFYKNQRDYPHALAWYEEARTILARDSGQADSYGGVCRNLGSLYYQMGNYALAGRFYDSVIGIDARNHGTGDTLYANDINSLGVISTFVPDYPKADTLFTWTREIRQRVYRETGASYAGQYASSCINLANLHVTTGDFALAEPLYLEAKAILEDRALTITNAYAQCCNGLANLYLDRGEYGEAEPLALKSLEVRGIVLGAASAYYALSCLTLANLYKAMGQYEKAETLYVEARQIRLKVYGDRHPLYAASCNILADLYYANGQYEKAEPLYLEAKRIRAAIPGKGPGQHVAGYAETCNNLATLYAAEGEYPKAEPLALEARAIWDSTLDPEDPNHAVNANILGSIYFGLGAYKKALAYYREAGRYWTSNLRPEHPYCIQNTQNLAKTCWNLADTGNARRLYGEALRAQYGLIGDVFRFTNEHEKEQYIRNSTLSGDEYQSFYTREYPAGRAGELYDLSLNGRGLILASSQELRQAVRKSGDPALLKTYGHWMAVKQELAHVYSNAGLIGDGRLKALEAEADSLEKDLARSSEIGKWGQAASGASWRSIRQHLKKDEAAIEFAQYRCYDGRRWTDSTYAVALLLRGDGSEPRSIPLFEERRLDSVLSATGADGSTDIPSIYTYRAAGPDYRVSPRGGYNSPGTVTHAGARGSGGSRGSRGIPQGIGVSRRAAATGSLYLLAWRPIEPYLKGIHTVYFAPAGLLHRVSFAAIPVSATQVVSDRYRLIQLNTTAEVTRRTERYIRSSDRIRLYGGVRYDVDPATLKQSVSSYYHYKEPGRVGEPASPVLEAGARSAGLPGSPGSSVSRSFMHRHGRRGEGWDYLPGTEQEVAGIGKLGRSFGVAVTRLSGMDASEESLKALNGLDTPAVLHIATHGFFFPDSTKAGDPLFNSGILLAGAGNTWNGHPVTGIEDGILTSYEVSNLYFPALKLVVLSACETALGTIEGSEGVYGLQRAFTMAGAQNLVMSLWKVPDPETAEFMQLFYENMLQGRSIGAAFYQTQQIMRSRYRKEPYKWAAWILLRG
ncbi:MAG: CHAT domain-containing protein [Puia sp.]|nr:CHAT domain-containing protein [Puia sp.]